ncbi:MAG: alpha/beta hydrolase [Bryobacteraceae bacterium]
MATCCLVTCSLLPAASAGVPSTTLPLWPKGAPGESAPIGPEHDTTTGSSPMVAGKRVARITNVSNPTIAVYPAMPGKNTGTAVLVFPGGGYSILAYDLEGTEVCDWLNSIGVTAVLVKYRVPARPGTPRAGAPLQDAQRAIRLVRDRAKQWGVGPNRIGVIGFSAGAHLSANLSNNFDKRTYDAVDDADKLSARPDFAAIVYPAYLTEKNAGETLASDMTVSARTPPTFLVQAEDDPVHVENSLVYYVALKKAKVPAEMHVFAECKHGYGLRRTNLPVTAWPVLAEQWLRHLGMLAK